VGGQIHINSLILSVINIRDIGPDHKPGHWGTQLRTGWLIRPEANGDGYKRVK